MADNHTPEVRSYNMSRIRSENTKPEEKVRKYLFSRGFRYRKNKASLPGKPDIVLTKYRAVVFVHGCFWHKHDCGRFRWPKSNQDYWNAKILNNTERDRVCCNQLRLLGWRVIIVWECELKSKAFLQTMENLIDQIVNVKTI